MKTTAGAITGWLTLIAGFAIVGALLGGWLLMLTVGVIHGEWLHDMPTIGYWSAVKVSVMLSIMTGAVVGGLRGSD